MERKKTGVVGPGAMEAEAFQWELREWHIQRRLIERLNALLPQYEAQVRDAARVEPHHPSKEEI
jgi:hypothetical protein